MTLKLEKDNSPSGRSSEIANQMTRNNKNSEIGSTPSLSGSISPTFMNSGQTGGVKGNFKFGYSNKRESLYKQYIAKLLEKPGRGEREGIMSALKEYNRKPSYAHITTENVAKETREHPIGLFSYKNKENKAGIFKSYEGLAPKRPSTTQDQFKTNFRKKMINSLVNKLVTS